MKRYIRLLILLLCLALPAILLNGCLSGAGPPAPVAEIPSSVAFPESVGIDVSQAGGSSGAAMKAAKAKYQATVTDFSDIISLGPIIFNAFNSLLDDFLGPLADLEIPVSPAVRTFEGQMTFEPGLVVPVKIDFADFDLDGDGRPEGCTGCTCPIGCAPEVSECPLETSTANLRPICYRIWIRDTGQTEFTRFSAGRIDRYATRDDPETEANEKNAGNGAFRLGVEATEPDGGSNPLAFGVRYAHRDDQEPQRQETEFFVQDRSFNPDGSARSFDNVHALVNQSQSGVVDSLEKLVKLDFRSLPDPPEGPGLVQYIGGFLDDFDFWSGTFNLQDVEGPDPMQISGENVCALISTGEATARENCLDLGIDVGGQEFLAPAQESDVAIPAGFPEAPTF
ncbi:MAG TPA: hypothetical protein VFW62_10005 [bacterium]|nr:hypothetical protein [bacterium]